MTDRQSAKWLELWAQERLGSTCGVSAEALLAKYSKYPRRLDQARMRCVENDHDPTFKCWEVEQVRREVAQQSAVCDLKKAAANDRG